MGIPVPFFLRVCSRAVHAPSCQRAWGASNGFGTQITFPSGGLKAPCSTCVGYTHALPVIKDIIHMIATLCRICIDI